MLRHFGLRCVLLLAVIARITDLVRSEVITTDALFNRDYSSSLYDATYYSSFTDQDDIQPKCNGTDEFPDPNNRVCLQCSPICDSTDYRNLLRCEDQQRKGNCLNRSSTSAPTAYNDTNLLWEVAESKRQQNSHFMTFVVAFGVVLVVLLIIIAVGLFAPWYFSQRPINFGREEVSIFRRIILDVLRRLGFLRFLFEPRLLYEPVDHVAPQPEQHNPNAPELDVDYNV